MELNWEYIESERKNIEENSKSELVDAILDYDNPLPDYLYDIFNYSSFMPSSVCGVIMKKHETNWVLHRRYEHFKKEGETFKECDNRLIKEFLNKTGLPIFK